jgi:gliding motility-associated-like protein
MKLHAQTSGIPLWNPLLSSFFSMTNKLKLIVFFMLIAMQVSAATYYVKPTASGSGTGISWANASADLQAIINGATAGDEIWVAAGTYIPTRDYSGNASPGDVRTRAFTLKDGVKLYGGFNGTETLLSQQNAASNITILSGDIGTPNVNTDNCYHVVLGVNLTNTTVFNGFTITDGYANGSSANYGGNTIYHTFGGGLLNAKCTYTVSNLIFTNNFGNEGAALVNTQAENLNPVPTVTINDCKFISNTSLNNSGAVYTHASVCNINRSVFESNTGGGVAAFPFGNFVIDRCVFVSNTSTFGGAARMRKGNLTVKNSVFANNSASQYAGAIFIVNENNESSSNIYNCTFYGNTAVVGGNAFWGPGSILYNCIFSNNTGAAHTVDGNNASSVEFSVIAANQINNAGTNSLRAATPAFVNTADLDGADNIWGTADDGLMIGMGTTAFNTGGSSYAQTIDIVGTARPQFGTVDIGAYESTVDYTPPAVPTITSFTPTSGIAGSTVTITGTNFNTTAANNIVYFGAVRSATPSSATATSLTVTIPLGAAYAPITVLNTANGLQAHSKTYFNPTHSSTKATIVEADFVKTNVSSGTPNIWSMPCERADLDLDGDIDLIMNNYNSTSAGLLVFPNTSSVGNITVGSSISYPVLAPIRGLVTADIDGDGKQDIIGVGDYNSVSIWRNTSTSSISFATRVDLSMAHSGNDVAVGDIDGDGKIDLVVTNNWAANISVFLNNSTSGTISFAPKVDLSAPTSVWGIKIGDINGDGKNDLIAANVNSSACFSIYRNTGTTIGTVSFATRADFTNGTTAGKWVELGDIDMDGVLDLVISNNEWIISVFRNTSSGNTLSFATPVSSNYGWVVDKVNIGDLNGDTKPDIIIPRGGMVAILTNNSTSGNISLTGQFDMGASSGGGMQSTEVVDLDRDGKLDIFGGSDNTKIDFYRYSPPPPPPPTITSFTPTSGPVGTTVTITGTNFNTTAANNIVFFGATKATVTAATATSLTVTVPVGATFGNITEVNMGTSLLAHSNANFTPTFTPNKSSIAATDFDPKIEIATGTGTTWPYQVALGDVDGDGKSDLVVANRAANNVAVFRNTSTAGTVSFATRVDFSTAQEARGLVLVDLDGDGKLDIATTGGNLNQVAFTVLRNTSTSGNISFATKIEINTTAATYSIASADIDGNGKADLIFGGQKMIIYPNISTVGNITFATPIDYAAAVNVNAIAVGDIDGDGKKDICFTAGSNVSVFRNISTIGAINLASKVDFAAPSAYGITIGDWDGDGKLDIAASLLNTTNSMSILTNTSTVGNISFATRIDNSSPQNPYFVAGGDLNGDGKADLVTTNAGQNGTAANLSVYRNTSTSGAASFASNVNLALGSWPYYAAIGDIDGDGRPDIVSSSVEANRVAIFRNNPQFQTVVATGTLSAFAGCSGSASTSQSFTVSGSALTANLVVTAPTGYEVSTTSGSGYASSVTLTPASGMVASTTIYVRLTATATGSPAGNITVASTGATTQNIAVTGSVTTISNQNVSASPTSICGTGASVVTVASTQTGVSYTLRNNANNAIVAGPIAGTGAAITFNTGTISTTTTYNVLAQTTAAGALQFDGVDDYVLIPNDNAFNISTYTAEGWVYPTGGADYKWIFGKRTGSNGWNLYITPSNTLELWNGFNSVATGPVIPFNTWSHVAITGSASGQKIYLNGVLVGSTTTVATPCDPSVPFTIGTNSDAFGPWFFGGRMDEVRVWNVERTASQLLNNMNTSFTGNETGLLAYYTFSDGNGSSTLADLAGGNNNGTLTNMNVNTAWVGGVGNSTPSCSLQMTATPTVTSTPAPTPTITAGGSTTFCTGGSVTLTASAGASYLWSNGATTQAITVTTGGSYTVQVTYSAGCFATSAATVVTVNPLPTPTITAGGPTTFCQGGSVTLTASAGSSYLWSTGATTQAITVSTAGNYNVRVTNANGCFATSANTTVTVNALPTATITAGGATTFCQGGSVVLTSNAGSSYLWSNNATTQSITANTSGNYTVTVTNANGCSTTSAVRTVTVNPLPVLTVTATPTSVSRGFNTQLNVTGSNLGTFAWTPTANLSSTTIANPIARVMSTTTYTVTVASSAGCTATGNVTVTALDDLKITSTNVFTPNGDGINDKFVIKNLDAYPNNKLQVMDRTGKVIYEKLNYANDWNGMVNGKLLTKDTYFFILIVNGQVLKKGTVTLVR